MPALLNLPRRLVAAVAMLALATAAMAMTSASAEAWAPLDCRNGATVQLLSTDNGYWVLPEYSFSGGSDAMLGARSGSQNSWTKFTMVCLDPTTTSSTFALRASNGKYVAVEVNYPGSADGMLRARSSSIGSWEKFRFDASTVFPGAAEGRLYSFATGKYVVTQDDYLGDSYGMLRASGNQIDRYHLYWNY